MVACATVLADKYLKLISEACTSSPWCVNSSARLGYFTKLGNPNFMIFRQLPSDLCCERLIPSLWHTRSMYRMQKPPWTASHACSPEICRDLSILLKMPTHIFIVDSWRVQVWWWFTLEHCSRVNHHHHHHHHHQPANLKAPYFQTATHISQLIGVHHPICACLPRLDSFMISKSANSLMKWPGIWNFLVFTLAMN